MTAQFSRRTLLRGIAATVLAVPAGASLAGCASHDEDLMSKATKQGYLTVAIGNEPPYTKVKLDGTVSGCEPDVCRAVCRRLGIGDIRGTVTASNGMIKGLEAGRWDVIAAGLFMNRSRCKRIDYSGPVTVSTESFGVPSGNPKGITTIKDLKNDPGLTVVVPPDSFEQTIVRKAGVPDSRIVPMNDNRSSVDAVISGRADAFLLPTLSLKMLAKDATFDVTAPIADAPKLGSAAGFRKSDSGFVHRYSRALKDFKETGEFAEILDKWGFDASAVKGVTSAEFCRQDG
jgi:polar amino acid transport system substrate-binding protein